MNIEKIVNKVVKKYCSRDPFEIIKGLDVVLVVTSLVGIRGFYQYFQRNHIIYIDESLSYTEKKFVCAHELGHMILHKNINAIFLDSKTQFVSNKYEIEADTFAMQLLISKEEIDSYCKEYTIEEISKIIGYSQKLIELRLK